MKKKFVLLLLVTAISIVGCSNTDNSINIKQENNTENNKGQISGDENNSDEKNSLQDNLENNNTQNPSTQNYNEPIINEEGMTLEERFNTPEGYNRADASSDSLTAFMRSYELKEAGADVLLYNGNAKGNQGAHAAVFALPIEEYDLQQCADSIMRVYAEYFWKTGQYDKIVFHFTNGFEARYSKWRDGNRIKVDGNNVYWSKTASYDESYESFVQYLKMVFMYAGTLSMETEAEPIQISDIQVGDVFLYGASPGHVVMIVDVCEDANGKKAFLLGQGYMPAQEFHILMNYNHYDDPWYYEDEVSYPFSTPEYTFKEGSLKRLNYLSW